MGFIHTSVNSVSIDSIEDPFASDSLKKCVAELEREKKVLILFFDQFEELFIKESLYDTFEAFRRLANSVEALRSNVILGFSWRTGIFFADSHPAQHLWNSLRERRAEFKIGPFTERESIEMIASLQRVSGVMIEPVLSQHLLDQSRRLPWLLKKLCVHVYRKLREGLSQRKLLNSQFDAKSLFQEDNSELSPEQLSCLRYIARNSPADVTDVHDHFDDRVLEQLNSDRLIIRSGAKYVIYWDIYREFLLTGDVSSVPLTYIPQHKLYTAISVFQFIREQGVVETAAIADNFGYVPKTVTNIIGDLTSFSLVDRVGNDKVRVASSLKSPDLSVIAERLERELSRHSVYTLIRNRVQPGYGLLVQELELLFAEVYPSLAQDTIQRYVARLMPWLEFAGLVENIDGIDILRPEVEGKGRGKGQLVKRRSTRSDGLPIFVCSSTPRRALDLAISLVLFGSVARSEIDLFSNRTAAMDLVALGLAHWSSSQLLPAGKLFELTSSPRNQVETLCFDTLRDMAMDSQFVKILVDEISREATISDERLAAHVIRRIDADWFPEAPSRYLNAGRSWLQFFGEFERLRGQLSLFDLLGSNG